MSSGRVDLVGAGPGDPGLLTLRGWDCLRQADLILYDGLVNPLLLRHTRGTAEKTSRMNGPDGSRLNQSEVTARMIAAAREGKRVVRLKGGDPYIFGRGPEEAADLMAAGIPYSVVPGVTSATGSAIYAGIPLTHRECASAVALITGHEDPTKPDTALDYAALAAFPGTLVFYMGLNRLPRIVESLLAAGKSGSTPTMVISRGTWPQQRSVSAPLQELPAAVNAAKLSPPSLIVVGDCAAPERAVGLNWTALRPLHGLRIGITRATSQCGETIDRVLESGGEPVLLPTIAIEPPLTWDEVDQTIGQLREFQWLVFTSANGVRGFLGRLWELGGDARALGHLKLAAIGSSTAARLEEFHLRADLVPAEFRAEGLAAELKPHVSGQRVLWARASRGRDVLPTELRRAGAEVTELVVYRNLDVEQWPEEVVSRLEGGEIDWIGLSSPSIARQFAQLLTPLARQRIGMAIRLCSISPVTTAAATEVGLPIAAEATTYTWDGILDAILQSKLHSESRGNPGSHEQ